MLRYRFCIIPALLFLVLFQNCAQMSPLTGGARDKEAPQLVSAQPPLSSTGFTNSSIVLKFDEYIQLKELNNNLVVLPKLKTLPEVEVNGKTLKISLDPAELKKNTTYRFFFGKAIADMNEGNALNNFEYTFSTGGFIDSLKLKGNVVNAFNNEALDNILIALYEDSFSNDSTVFKDVPNYITKSNASGKFSLSHLPAKRFRAYAIDDVNKNLTYDPDGEKIGFLDMVISLPEDSSLNFSVFKEVSAKTYVKKTISPYYGHTMIVFNKTPKVLVQTFYPEQEAFLVTQPSATGDTLLLYYRNINDSLKIILNYAEEGKKDTLLLSLAKKSLKKKRFAFMRANTPGNTLNLNTALTISFITWMDTTRLDLTKFSLRYKEDSLWKNHPLNPRWLSVRELQLADGLPEGKDFELKLDTAALLDAFSNANDSAKFQFKTQSRNELGKAVLKLQLFKKEQYLVQLLSERQDVIKEQSFFLSLSSSNNRNIEFTDVPPGVYKVRIVYDLNKNEKWDTGSLLKNKQAEPIFMHSKTIKVLSDWEIEEEIQVKEENRF
jgi:hypothetical protein